jgi:uncharacterized protein
MVKKKLITSEINVEAAIQKGLEKIGLPQSKTIIQILQKENSNFFTKKDATVAILYDEEDSRKALINTLKEQLSLNQTLLWEEEQVKLKVPQLIFKKELFENNQERFEFLMSWVEKHNIEPIQQNVLLAISNDPNSYKKYITICKLETHPLNKGTGSLYLRVSKDKMLAEAAIFFEGTISEQDIFDVLKENNITKGVLKHTIQKVLENKYSNIFPIAQGKPASDDHPGHLEIYFEKETHLKPSIKEDNSSINTRNIKSVNVVSRNDLLMEIGSPIKGYNGFLIDGTTLLKKENSSSIQLGKNVYKTENGKEIYSAKAGHVIWRSEDQFLDVEDIYIIEGNVDFSEGNVSNFSGKVLITGDVRPKFSVVADGDIEIQGSVEDATIESKKGDVIIHGVVVNKIEGYVKAANSIYATIATNAILKAKNIYIEKESMNCNLEATNKIVIEGAPGVLVGGIAHAKNLIRSRVIGSSSWIQTKIHVGDISSLQKKQRVLTQYINDNESRLKQLKDSIKILELQQNSTQAEQKEVEKLKIQMNTLKEELTNDCDEKNNIELEINQRKDARLEILDTLYPKVDLQIFKGYLLPNEKQTHTGFYWRNGIVTNFNI